MTNKRKKAIRLPTYATSLRPVRSMDRRELFVPRTRTTMTMSRSFADRPIAPSLWNRLFAAPLALRPEKTVPSAP